MVWTLFGGKCGALQLQNYIDTGKLFTSTAATDAVPYNPLAAEMIAKNLEGKF
jgi:hypothetical protein